MSKIRVAIIGVGNCAKSLVEGVALANMNQGLQGLGFEDISGYKAEDIEFVMGFDIDQRKIGEPLSVAITQKPNCAVDLIDYNDKESILTLGEVASGVVYPSPLLDGMGPDMYNHDIDSTFLSSSHCLVLDQAYEKSRFNTVQAYAELLESNDVDVLVNYLPVGSKTATEFYADVSITAGVPFVNCIPEFIASDPSWAQKFVDAKIPIIGDDMRSMVGASIISAALQELFLKRGAKVDVHYQDNIGGNTDFLNMQDQSRLASKKISKENVIRSQNDIAGVETKENTIAAGPAKYFPALGDNKRASWLIKGSIFGGAEFEFTADLSCQDSPNSAGVVIDAIRFLKVAEEIGIVGPVYGPSAWTQKTPPLDMRPSEAYEECVNLADGYVPNGYVHDDSSMTYVHKSLT